MLVNVAGGAISLLSLAAVAIDAFGRGSARIPLTGARLAGLLLMALAILLLLPRR